MIKDRIINAIFEAVDIINEQLSKAQRLDKSIDAVLIGETSKLDSLGLINFIVAVEQKIEDEFNKTVTLTEDEDLISSTEGPFQTIGTLSDYLADQLEEKL
jgi:acyl carrier protein